MRTCKFFPSIAEIMEAARELVIAATGERTADMDEAWREVQKAMKETLAFHQPEFSTHEIKQAVDTIGWTTFLECKVDDFNTLRAQFLRIYESICRRKNTERINNNVLRLVGADKIKMIGEKGA